MTDAKIVEMQDAVLEVERLARNAGYLLAEVQEEYFECNNPGSTASVYSIVNNFERNKVKVDIISDIICKIVEVVGASASEIGAS